MAEYRLHDPLTFRRVRRVIETHNQSALYVLHTLEAFCGHTLKRLRPRHRAAPRYVHCELCSTNTRQRISRRARTRDA